MRAETVARVIAALSRADGSIGQIPQNHFFMLEGLRLEGTEEQKRFFYGRVLAGERLGNALSETGTKTAHDHATRLTRDGSIYRLNGRKFYSTGVLFAHWVAVVANDEDNVSRIAFVPRDTDGITIVDDWSGFGQRVTGSGTTVLKDVRSPSLLAPVFLGAVRPSDLDGPIRPNHARGDRAGNRRGRARGHGRLRPNLRPAVERRWRRTGERRSLSIAAAGELKIRVDASSALLARAGTFVDRAQAEPSVETIAAASVAVAESKIASTEAALNVASKLIELGGSSATLVKHGFDRHWRNARTHTRA